MLVSLRELSSCEALKTLKVSDKLWTLANGLFGPERNAILYKEAKLWSRAAQLKLEKNGIWVSLSIFCHRTFLYHIRTKGRTGRAPGVSRSAASMNLISCKLGVKFVEVGVLLWQRKVFQQS